MLYGIFKHDKHYGTNIVGAAVAIGIVVESLSVPVLNTRPESLNM